MSRLKGQALLASVSSEQLKEVVTFAPGDTVQVNVKIKEGNRDRLQMFEGLVIKRSGEGISETFTVRKNSYGVGVERTFPVNSPAIESIVCVRRGKVRRAKLHYIRSLSKKASRIKEKREV